MTPGNKISLYLVSRMSSNFKAEEGEENQYYTLNFLVGEYSSLVNTLKRVENLISENEKALGIRE